MKRTFFVFGLAGATLVLAQCSFAADSGAAKRILFFTKSSGYEHSSIKHGPNGELSPAEKVLQELGPKNHFEFTFSKDGTIFTAQNLEKFDAFFFYTTGDLTTPGEDHNPPMSKEGKATFLEAIHNGKGFIGTHSATDTFHSPGFDPAHLEENYKGNGENTDPYVKMIGAEFIVHGAQQTSHMLVTDGKFPGLNQVPSDFQPLEEWYALKNFAPNLHVLLVQDTSGMKGPMYERPPYPATWARLYGKGRVFYTNMGHREDIWTNPVFQAVLVGGINWAVRNVDADVTPNIEKVTPKASETRSTK